MLVSAKSKCWLLLPDTSNSPVVLPFLVFYIVRTHSRVRTLSIRMPRPVLHLGLPMMQLRKPQQSDAKTEMDLSSQTTGAEEDATVSSLHMDDPMDPIDTVLFADDLSDSVDFLLVFELVDFVLILDTSHLMLFALVITSAFNNPALVVLWRSITYFVNIIVLFTNAGFTMVYIMYGISDHSPTESRAFRTRVLILDLLRSKAEWDQWYEFMFNRNVFLCLFTVGLWTPCLLRKASVQYPGHLNWRLDHPRPDCWVSPGLVPVDDPAEGILSLNEYLLLPDPTRAELSTSPEIVTIHSILQAIPVSVQNNLVSTRLPLLRNIDSKYNDLWHNYRSSLQSPQDLNAFEARKLLLNTARSRIEWEEWHWNRVTCATYACIFSLLLLTPCYIKVACEEFPGLEAWRSQHPEPESWPRL